MSAAFLSVWGQSETASVNVIRHEIEINETGTSAESNIARFDENAEQARVLAAADVRFNIVADHRDCFRRQVHGLQRLVEKAGDGLPIILAWWAYSKPATNAPMSTARPPSVWKILVQEAANDASLPHGLEGIPGTRQGAVPDVKNAVEIHQEFAEIC